MILLVGHRGARAYEPENTIRSFAAGIEMGANAIELDTRVTKDKKLVSFHDRTLERTTNGKGAVADFSLKELRALDAGKGENIPTAEEALAFIVRKNAVALMEIKDKDSADDCVAVVKKLGFEKKVIIHSFYTEAIKKVKELAPEIQTALVVSNKIKNTAGFFRLLRAIKADWIFSEAGITDKDFVDEAHRQKFKVEVWVCNTVSEIRKFLEMGVDGIASDKPDLFKKVKL